MNYKTAFLLAMKIIGLYLLVEGVSSLIIQVSWFVLFMISQGTSQFQGASWTHIANFASFGFKGAAGAYLLFGGKYLANKAIPGNRPYCPGYSYDSTDAAPAKCPECGTLISCDTVQSRKTST